MTVEKQRWRGRQVFTAYGYQFHLTRVLSADGDARVEYACFVTAADKPVYYGNARAESRAGAIRGALKNCQAHLAAITKRIEQCATAALAAKPETKP